MRRSCLVLASHLAFLSLVTGCIFGGRQSDYETALPEDVSTVHPDERREAVVDIAKSFHYDSDPSFAVLDAVARTDPEPQIRCIAIRALARYEDSRPIDTFMTVTTARQKEDGAVPGDDDVRWEGVNALVEMLKEGYVPEAKLDNVRQLLVDLARNDPSRNVRLSAIEGLGYIQDELVFGPLVSGLRSRNFSVADASEMALVQLTGVTHHYDPDRWQEWLANTNEPFANAGEMPDELKNRDPSWWDVQRRRWRRTLKLGPDE